MSSTDPELQALWQELRAALRELAAVDRVRAEAYLRGAVGSIRGLTKALRQGSEDGKRGRRSDGGGGGENLPAGP